MYCDPPGPRQDKRRQTALQVRARRLVHIGAYAHTHLRFEGWLQKQFRLRFCLRAAHQRKGINCAHLCTAVLGSKQRIYTKVAFLAEVSFLVVMAAKREYIQSGQGGPL